jgi:RHS repeat-associated protein
LYALSECSSVVETYEYDYLGNRTAKTSNGIRTEYTTDLSTGYSQVIKATKGSKSVYYTRGFELISRQEGSAASYYIYDGGLSVRALTNEAGTVTDTLVFNAFGNETAKTGSTDNSYGFQGEEKDETGLYYLRARYMDPSTGTFTSMDTYGGSLSDPMSLHKYMFANSNPVMYSDPSGHATLTEQMLVCGLIGELASSTIYLVELFTTDNIQYNSWYEAGYGALRAVISGFAAGVVMWALHTVFAAIVGMAVAAIVFGSFGAVMSILGIFDAALDWENGDTDLGTVKVIMSVISLFLSVFSINLGVKGFYASTNINDGQTVYRTMKDNNGMPETGNSARTLGSRPGYGTELNKGEDILVDSKGMVKPESGGMSVVPSPEDLVDIRRPPAYGGRGKDPLWSINTNTLGPKLKYVPDIPEGATHGTIQPAYPRTYNEYQNALGDTQPFWRLEP